STCELADDELDFVLRHELCHVARHDTRAIYFIDFAQRCFAGHPSLRPLASEIRVAREARADEAAAGPRALEYARFLLTIAQHMESRHSPYGSLVSMADTALERRVDMLINTDRPRPRRSAPWLVLTGLGLCSLVFLAPSSIGQTQGNANDHPTVRGNLTVEQVEQALFTNAQPMLNCYNGLAAPRPNLPVRLSFEIDERGKVSSGRVTVPDHPELEPCLHAALMQRSFPRPSSGTVSVEAPTLLTPPYDERRAVLEAREGTSQSLSRDLIRTTMRSYFPQLRSCFERVDKTLHSVSINMSFVIGRDGRAIDGQTSDKSEPPADPAAFAQFAQCVDDVRNTMQFPVPEDGIVTVDYPITFGHEP
ncbi:MAG TPA: M56 family metallopeptidase, partial [Polyangiales bacterium]|nr:M56 family metallopeptidase [Polyangiales bacterium]